jgi:hypothetical protein
MPRKNKKADAEKGPILAASQLVEIERKKRQETARLKKKALRDLAIAATVKQLVDDIHNLCYTLRRLDDDSARLLAVALEEVYVACHLDGTQEAHGHDWTLCDLDLCEGVRLSLDGVARFKSHEQIKAQYQARNP